MLLLSSENSLRSSANDFPTNTFKDDDIITRIPFEKRGDYLAVGDRGGRVLIFERDDRIKNVSEHHHDAVVRVIEKIWSSWISLLRGIPSFFTRRNFRVTSPSLIISKIVEIEKRINKVRWGITHNGLLFLLSTNDKTIKLWKVKEHKVKQVKEMAPILCSENMLLAERSYICGQETHSAANGYHLEWTEKMPGNLLQPQDIDTKISGSEDTVHTKCRKVYSYAHGFNINSISNNSDIETFISADDLRINLWNLEVSDECFNIIDMKPSNMEDLTEIITSAEFHPLHCNLLAYSSSRLTRFYSSIRFAVCDHASRM